MAKVLVNVRIGDNEDKNYTKLIQVEINTIDYLVIQDQMEICSSEEFDESWERLIKTIERNPNYYLPSGWYVDGEIEFCERIY